jgi:hypothetical protein
LSYTRWGTVHGTPVTVVGYAARMKNFLSSVFGLIVLAAAVVIGSLPATWMLMLGFGNIGAIWSFWDMLPFGIIVSFLIGGATAPSSVWMVRSSNAPSTGPAGPVGPQGPQGPQGMAGADADDYDD